MNDTTAVDAGSTTDEILDFVAWTPYRLRSMKMIIHGWLHPAGLHRATSRYAAMNAPLREVLRRTSDATATGSEGEYSDFTRVWFRYPNGVREEHYRLAEEIPSEWGRERVVYPDAPRRYSAVPVLPPGDEPEIEARGEDELPDYLFLFHPLTAELLEPVELLGSLTFETVGVERYLDREALSLTGTADWRREDPQRFENRAVADEYRALVDRESGILLRFACVLDGDEFSGQEVTYLEVELGSQPGRQ